MRSTYSLAVAPKNPHIVPFLKNHEPSYHALTERITNPSHHAHQRNTYRISKDPAEKISKGNLVKSLHLPSSRLNLQMGELTCHSGLSIALLTHASTHDLMPSQFPIPNTTRPPALIEECSHTFSIRLQCL